MQKISFAKLCAIAIAIFFISACESIPEAPDVEFCGLFGPLDAECQSTDPAIDPYVRRTFDMQGYRCLSPKDFGEIDKYHNRLRKQLDRCLEGK